MLAKSLAQPFIKGWSKPKTRIQRYDGSALIALNRYREKSGSRYNERNIRCGGQHVHAFVTHEDGTFTDLGVSHNLLTNIGRDWMSSLHGAFVPTGSTGASPATAVSASAVTVTGTPLTASNLASPELGCAGTRIWMPVTSVGTSPVYANIVSNTTSVLTIDHWWNSVDGTPTTPAATNAFQIAHGGYGSARFMALTADAAAANAADTVLATEITTNLLARALATYAHTQGASTFTLQVVFNPNGSQAGIHKMGLFSCLTQGGTTAALGGPLLYETVLNADATVVSGDQLTVTDTFTPSGT